MTIELPMATLSIAAAVVGVLGLILVVAGIVSLVRARFWRFAGRTIVGLAFIILGLVAGAIGLGLEGYDRLTREELVAKVNILPIGPQRFDARFTFPQSHISTFELSGDEIQVDAKILKWSPRANLLGLHTMYELDRVQGRYRSIEQQKSAPRTIFPLSSFHYVDLFEWRQRFPQLARFFDAEYGSASFVPANRPIDLELYVTTSGLIFRQR